MIPAKITAGDSVVFNIESLQDGQGRSICGPDWTAKISIRGNSEAYLNATADSNWKFTLSKTQTALLPVGDCFFQIYAENDTERITINTGKLTILPNLSSGDADGDFRSQTQKDLEQVQSLIRDVMANGGVVEYQIHGRKAKKYELADLLALEAQYKARLIREQKADRIRNGLGNPHKALVRFK